MSPSSDEVVAEGDDPVEEAVQAVGQTSLDQFFEMWQQLVEQVDEGSVITAAWTEYE